MGNRAAGEKILGFKRSKNTDLCVNENKNTVKSQPCVLKSQKSGPISLKSQMQPGGPPPLGGYLAQSILALKFIIFYTMSWFHHSISLQIIDDGLYLMEVFRQNLKRITKYNPRESSKRNLISKRYKS